MIGNHWLFSLLLLASAPAVGATYVVGIGDDCDSIAFNGCFSPSQLTIHVGDTVEFLGYADSNSTGDHNVVADDGSFRCARGCDGEGGDGTPVSGFRCNARTGGCVPDATFRLDFKRQFNVSGIVKYHDEVGGAPGVIIVTPDPIGSGYTGSWFNPEQSGHGIALEILMGQPLRMLASWFTFAPNGDQAWIVGVGPVTGSQAVLQGYQTVGAGGRFPPNFDAANVHQETWGTLTFTFSDCNHGRVEWVSSVPGYGSGGLDLTRLTLPAGLTCPQ